MDASRKPGRPPGTAARYRAVAADIARRVKAGEWAAGDPIPSYQQFAAKYGVGVATIRLAVRLLGRKGLVRILPGRPTTVLGSTQLKSPVQDAIGMIVNWTVFSDATRDLWYGAAEAAARSSHARIVVLQYLDNRDFLRPEGLEAIQLRGILLPCVTPPELLNHLAVLNIPVVLLDQPPMGCKVHAVTVDNFDAAYDATLRLIALGHRRLAFVRSIVSSLQRVDPDGVERQAGFVSACVDAGLTGANYEIFSAGFGETSAAAITLVRARQRFTAVVTSCAEHAVQIEHAARNAGLQIPRDLSIETFQTKGHKLTRNWTGPQLDLREIGGRGVEIIERKPRHLERVYVHAIRQDGDSVASPPKIQLAASSA